MSVLVEGGAHFFYGLGWGVCTPLLLCYHSVVDFQACVLLSLFLFVFFLKDVPTFQNIDTLLGLGRNIRGLDGGFD